MPASLTNQIRLGFSLGWRIWTPNEVGFYAKSLAHSYFIYNVLSTKFFMKKLWVVNYSIFVGVRKYYVFIEYLKFGMKTKEERSYWKKVMYITLMVRHPSLAKSNKLRTDDNYALTRGIYKYFGKLEKKKYKTEIDRHRDIYLLFLANVKKKHTFIVRNEMDILIEKITKDLNTNNIKKTGISREDVAKMGELAKTKYKKIALFDYADPEYLKILMSILKYNYITKKKQKIVRVGDEKQKEDSKISTIEESGMGGEDDSVIRYRIGGIKPKTIINIVDSLTDKTKTKIIKRNPSNSELTKRWELSKFKQKTKIAANLKNDAELWKAPFRLATNDYDRLQHFSESFFGGKAATKIASRLNWSFQSGPRMRKYRKLKRSFQSKNIIKYTTLIWFWQKVSKLLCFYMEWTLRYLK